MVPSAIRRLLRGTSSGQALVETAIILPILLILLVMAIDFGRAYFSWVNLNQAARVGANYAASHPSDDYSDTDTRYYELINREAAGINCDVDGPDGSELQFTGSELGDYATVRLLCDFTLITPLAAQILGGTVSMSAESTFPIRAGCIGCPPPQPPPVPPEPENHCRIVPTLAGMSLDGAKHAWVSAGFQLANFSAPTGTPGSATVASSPAPLVEEDISDSNCPTDEAIFSSSVQVWTMPADPVSGCATVPNMIGMTIAEARSAWQSSGFDPSNFDPPPADDDSQATVASQVTDPPSEPGVSCRSLDATVSIEPGPAWPAAPPAPCRVPNFIDTKKNDAQNRWVQALFTTQVELIGRASANWPIKAQSLVGGTWMACDVSITLHEQP